ncbi:MAG: PqqD family peptide modification chaperone [Ilumatobacteraceae bacterium]
MQPGPRRRVDIPWVVIDGDVVLVDRSSESVHVLVGAASAVWQLLDGDGLEGLAGLVAHEFGLTEAAAEVDLANALGALAAIGVVDVT